LDGGSGVDVNWLISLLVNWDFYCRLLEFYLTAVEPALRSKATNGSHTCAFGNSIRLFVCINYKSFDIMHDIINKYLKSNFGDIEVPSDEEEKIKLARTLFGVSIVNALDYWLDYAKDLIDNDNPEEPVIRDNELSRKDKLFRDTFSKLDNETKKIIIKLINSITTGIVFSMLTNFDQFDFGELILFLKPKATDKTEIKISSDLENLHDELSEWIYAFSKFKIDLVAKEENKHGTSYRLK
jgi:hypothetical protein